MTAEIQIRLRRVERVMLGIAGIAFIAAFLLGWHAPAAIPAAWRLAIFACLQPALGSLMFILIYRMTGGQWFEGIAPYLVAGTRLLPWVWLIALPLLWLSPPMRWPSDAHAAPKNATAASAHPDEASSAKTATNHPSEAVPDPSKRVDRSIQVYFSRPFIFGRAIGYAVAFFLFTFGAMRAVRREARTQMRWFGPAGLILLAFMLHLLVIDWYSLLDPGWFATGAPLVWMAAQGLAGLALAVCLAVSLGEAPERPGAAERPRGLDWGNLLLAAVMSWTYVAFVQLLIIWSGNLPAEISWYAHRSVGVWRWVSIGLGAVAFGAPFFILLSRQVKQRRRNLAAVAGLLVCGQLAYTTWIIRPAFPNLTAAGSWLCAAAVAAAFGLFLNRYLAAARVAAAMLES